MKKIYLLLILIIVFALFLRVYKLASVPPSLTWDEAAVGYNAYTIANWGRDEYGKLFPLVFRSFGEDKQPIHIYATAIFVKLFGLSEFTIRIPVVIFSLLNILLIFFLVRTLFKSNWLGLLSSLFLCLSPQNIFFSRFNHEANFTLFFFMLGLFLFYKAVQKRRDLLPLSIIIFFLAIISYHAAEIFVPLFLVFISILYYKKIYENKANILIISLVLTGFTLLCFFNPELLGIARYNQTIQGKGDLEKVAVFQITHNELLGRASLAFNQYLWHFSPNFLFIKGDKNPRLSSQGTGELYWIDAIFLLVGLGYLLHKREKEHLLIIGWVLLGPLPSSLFAEAPHAGRAVFMMGSWQIMAAVGFYELIGIIKKPFFKMMVIVGCLLVVFASLIIYLKFYFNEFPQRYAIDWQFGMKQIVNYAQAHPEYLGINTTVVRAQPYIFYLYYLAQPLPDYLNSVIYNNSWDRDFNNVSFFDRYSFGGWNYLTSDAQKGVLYVLTPSEYDGLRYRDSFEIKKMIYYPNGANAFFLVTLK